MKSDIFVILYNYSKKIITYVTKWQKKRIDSCEKALYNIYANETLLLMLN